MYAKHDEQLIVEVMMGDQLAILGDWNIVNWSVWLDDDDDDDDDWCFIATSVHMVG